MQKPTIALIGSGNMGASLIGGLINDGYPADHLWVSDPATDKVHQLQHQFNIRGTSDNQAACAVADVVIFAVKPQYFATVASDLAPTLRQKKPLIMSVAAGVRTQTIQNWLGGEQAIVRTMPNTPALIGCGASALFANTYVSQAQREIAESILRAVGLIVWLEEEKLMDVVTALSGSGPAYFFLMMEALQQAGEALGLPQEVARLLTLQTGYGTTRMALESDTPLATLRQHVTSPGGTTAAAIDVLENENIRHIFKAAITAAAHRADELANHADTAGV